MAARHEVLWVGKGKTKDNEKWKKSCGQSVFVSSMGSAREL